MATAEVVQFVPFVSRLDAGFWHELSRRKLEKYHLSEAAQYISGYYANSKFGSKNEEFSIYTRPMSTSQIQCLDCLLISYWSTVDFNSMFY